MPVDTHVADQDEQLQEAILAYLKAADSGQPERQLRAGCRAGWALRALRSCRVAYMVRRIWGSLGQNADQEVC